MKTINISYRTYDEDVELNVDISQDVEYLDTESFADLIGAFCLHANIDVEELSQLFIDRFGLDPDEYKSYTINLAS